MAGKPKQKSKPKCPQTQTSPAHSKAVATGTSHRPNWPPLKPLVDPLDLKLLNLLPKQILVIPNFFTTTLCKTYVQFLSTLPLTTTPNKPKRGEAVRVNDRFQIHDADFANQLWTQTSLRDLVSGFDDSGWHRGIWGGDDGGNGEHDNTSSVLGLNPNIRIYRYRPGQFFDKHYDESNKLDFIPTAGNKEDGQPIAAQTTWTLLIYLSTCEGGETVFYQENPGKGLPSSNPIVVQVQAGLALLHRHGEDCLLHEGREVTGGEKWILRSDLVVQR